MTVIAGGLELRATAKIDERDLRSRLLLKTILSSVHYPSTPRWAGPMFNKLCSVNSRTRSYTNLACCSCLQCTQTLQCAGPNYCPPRCGATVAHSGMPQQGAGREVEFGLHLQHRASLHLRFGQHFQPQHLCLCFPSKVRA